MQIKQAEESYCDVLLKKPWSLTKAGVEYLDWVYFGIEIPPREVYRPVIPVIHDPPVTSVDTKKSKWKAYKRRVRNLTEQVAHLIPNIEKRSFEDYHIDHIISIWDGFHKGIPEEQIADIKNLRIMTSMDNLLKGRKSH